MDIFDMIDIQPNKSIKVISSGGKDRIRVIRNITHMLRGRYNMDVVIVSPSYTKTKHTEYEKTFATTEMFLRAINSNNIRFNQNTILVLDDCCDHTKYYNVLSNISKDSKFCNIIFGVSKTWSTFWNIDTDITFCLHGTPCKSIYERYIDQKIMPLNIFGDIFGDCVSDDNLLMIDQKDGEVIIKKCIPEKPNTHRIHHEDCFSYDKNVRALYYIYNNLSIYHDINGELYKGLWENVNFIVKCSYLLFVFGVLRADPYGCWYLPRELHSIILHLVIQTYQKQSFGKRKRLLLDEDQDYIFHSLANLDYVRSGLTD